MLAWRPGELTRRYVAWRAGAVRLADRLVPVLGLPDVRDLLLVGGPVQSGSSPETRAEARADVMAEFTRDQRARATEIAELRRERAEQLAGGRPTASIDASIRRLERRQRSEEQALRQALAIIDAGGDVGATPTKAGQQPKAEEPVVLVPNARPENSRVIDLDGAEIDTGSAFLDRAITKAQGQSVAAVYKLQNNAYKFSWALIPISVPFVWLLFLHRRRYRQFKAYDHTVFVTYSISFMSLGLIVLSLLRPLGLPEGIAVLTMMFVPPIHIYRQLRGAYQLSRFSALWRTAMLLWFAFIAATLFFVLLVAFGALG